MRFDLFGWGRVTSLEVEVARLQGRVAAQEEQLAAKREEVRELRGEIKEAREREERLLAQFVDLAGARALRLHATAPPNGSSPSLRQNGKPSSNGNGGNPDSEEETPMRLSRKQRQQRQQAREMVDHGLMDKGLYAKLWGAADEQESR